VSSPNRVFTPEFRLQVVQRILAGESVSKLHYELGIKRAVLYRWHDRYCKEGAEGLSRLVGRPSGVPNPNPEPCPDVSLEEALRLQIASLERKVGQQEVMLDFFKRAFKRVKESNQGDAGTGATASTRRSGQ